MFLISTKPMNNQAGIELLRLTEYVGPGVDKGVKDLFIEKLESPTSTKFNCGCGKKQCKRRDIHGIYYVSIWKDPDLCTKVMGQAEYNLRKWRDRKKKILESEEAPGEALKEFMDHSIKIWKEILKIFRKQMDMDDADLEVEQFKDFVIHLH